MEKRDGSSRHSQRFRISWIFTFGADDDAGCRSDLSSIVDRLPEFTPLGLLNNIDW